MTAAPSSWWLQGTIIQWETESDELSNLVRVRRQERSSVLSAGGRRGAGWELASRVMAALEVLLLSRSDEGSTPHRQL